MGQYFKAAILARLPVPGLGQVPINVIGIGAFSILGFVVPWLWLVGLGVETFLVLGLATNKRFQEFVDGQQLQLSAKEAESRRGDLILTLPVELQQRMIDLRRRTQKVIEVSEHTSEFVAASNRETVQRVESVYLKLLIARNNLAHAGTNDSVETLTSQIAGLEDALKNPGAGESLRQSREATLATLKERLANIQSRKETLDEVESDLTRIEAQVELMLGNASLEGKPATIATDIELKYNLTGLGETDPLLRTRPPGRVAN